MRHRYIYWLLRGIAFLVLQLDTVACLLQEVVDKQRHSQLYVFPLKERNLEVSMLSVRMIGSSILAEQTRARSRGGKAVCLLIVFLTILEISEDPPGLAFLECPISVSLDGKDPAASDKVLWKELPDIEQGQRHHCQPVFDLNGLGFHEELGMDHEFSESRLLASLILMGSCKSPLVPTRKQHEAERRYDIREAITQPTRGIQSLRIVPELSEEALG